MRVNYNKDMNSPTEKANINMWLTAAFTIEENKNNYWRGYDRNYTIKMDYWGHVYNYMTIGKNWGCLEYIDENGNGWNITLHNIDENGLDIVSAATFKNHNRNITKEYRHERYLKKYTKVAYMIYALSNLGYLDTTTAA